MKKKAVSGALLYTLNQSGPLYVFGLVSTNDSDDMGGHANTI